MNGCRGNSTSRGMPCIGDCIPFSCFYFIHEQCSGPVPHFRAQNATIFLFIRRLSPTTTWTIIFNILNQPNIKPDWFSKTSYTLALLKTGDIRQDSLQPTLMSRIGPYQTGLLADTYMVYRFRLAGVVQYVKLWFTMFLF